MRESRRTMLNAFIHQSAHPVELREEENGGSSKSLHALRHSNLPVCTCVGSLT